MTCWGRGGGISISGSLIGLRLSTFQHLVCNGGNSSAGRGLIELVFSLHFPWIRLGCKYGMLSSVLNTPPSSYNTLGCCQGFVNHYWRPIDSDKYKLAAANSKYVKAFFLQRIHTKQGISHSKPGI